MRKTFVDIHHHLLYGMDDGPRGIEEMEAMIDAAYSDGIRMIIATPHASPGIHPFDMDFYAKKLAQANDICSRKGYELSVCGGSEIMYRSATIRLLQNNQIPSLAETRFVLTEWPQHVSMTEVTEAIRNLSNAGYIPIMAHVERLRCLRGRLDILRQMKNSFDVRIQVNTESILSGTSMFSRNVVSHLLQSRLVDYVATDAHDVQGRQVQMKAAYLRLRSSYGKDYADDLTYTKPMEIIEAMDKNS